MNQWSEPEDEVEKYLPGFLSSRGVYGTHQIIEACRVILTHKPRWGTCSYFCQRSHGCSHRTSEYCRVQTTPKGKYTPNTLWEQWTYFSNAIERHRSDITKALGDKRIEHFIQAITDEAIKDVQSKVPRKERKKYSHITPVDLVTVTISDLEKDPWSAYVRNQTKGDNLLCSTI